METHKTLKKILKKEAEKREVDQDFHEKNSLFLKMKEGGLLRPQGYGIAPLDTAGKRKYLSKRA